jgi:hypothetical protein
MIPAKDFKVIASSARFEGLLTVTKDLRSRPPRSLSPTAGPIRGKLSFATGNTTSLVMAELFTRRLGIEAVKVPTRAIQKRLPTLSPAESA